VTRRDAKARPAPQTSNGENSASALAWMRENMSKNRLEILRHPTHCGTFMAPSMARAPYSFLNGESGAPSWTEPVGEGSKRQN
jgi:hypothetical protein